MARIRVNFRDNNRIPEIISDLSKTRNKKARVGYIRNTEMAKIAAVHEYGCRIEVTDKMRNYLATQGLHLKKDTTHIVIPERSFLRTGADSYGESVYEKAKMLINDVIAGSISIDLFYEMLALELKGKIQEHAIDLKNPANHPFTIERKGSANPLVDSGDMIGKMEIDVE